MASLIRKLVAFGGARQAERRALSDLFDEAFYLDQYSDVRSAGGTPLEHFMTVGWSEGRNPSAHFDVQYYLEQNPDVKAVGMNPVLHYIRFGKAEGRLPRPPFEGDPAKPLPAVAEEDIDAVEPFFDPDYYLAMYPDVKQARLDPLRHFMTTGWREYRNPSANFNTATYLQLNSDVRNAGINPLVHYANNGKHEDRIIRLNCLEELKVLTQKFQAKPSHDATVSLTVEPIHSLAKILTQLESRRMVVALSHDDYLANIGGVQVFIREEEEKLRAGGFSYVHLSPVSTGGIPKLGRDYVRVIIDRSDPMIYQFDEVLDLLGRDTQDRELTLIIHSLINFDEEFVLDGILALPWRKKYHWIHDYSLLCSEFNLLRNGVKWCGLPAKESAVCYTCSGYKSRPVKEQILGKLTAAEFIFVAPSDAAKRVVAASGLIASDRIHVVNHLDLIAQDALRKRLRSGKRFIRVAYCGHPVLHKGWALFQQIVEFSITSSDYRFYHLGVHDTHLNGAEFVSVRNTAESRDAMVRAIRDLEIDVVVVAAQWAETFCYVAYEAILGGAMVFTTDASGNVAALSSSTPCVISFPDNRALIEAFTSGRAKEIALDAHDGGLPAYLPQNCGTTAALELADEK